MATVVKSMATAGVDGFLVEIEASTLKGQQQMLSIIGLPDQAIKEAGERIQAAIESCGYEIPKEKTVISLAPGNLKKRGSHFDLGMIIALLYQTDQISPKNLEEYALIGEISLDGRIRPCNGVLSMVTEARKCGIKSVIVPYENRTEAASVSGLNVCPVKTLRDTVRFLEGRLDLSQQDQPEEKPGKYIPEQAAMDFADVRGQDELAEFSRSTLDALRQPMEDKKVTISRVNGTNTYPANFMSCTCRRHVLICATLFGTNAIMKT